MTEESVYILKIPHCLDEGHDRNKVKVRMIHDCVADVSSGLTDRLVFFELSSFYAHLEHFCWILLISLS